MDWMYIVALIVMIPIILLPVAFVWYLNLSGLIATLKKSKKAEEVTIKKEVT